jgi:hypothetical protein
MNQKSNPLETFGDVRRMILDTIVDLRNEKLDVSRGMAIAANFKVLNDNIQAEINATKLSIQTDGSAHEFGRVVRMGRRLIGSEAEDDQAMLQNS